MTKRLLAGATIVFGVAAASGMSQAPGMNADEKALVAFVDAHNNEALTLLERVVNINSGTQNHAGVQEVGKVFRQELDALGFKTRWVDGAPFKRAGHLIGEHPGSGPKILLIGHLDTVFEADSPFQKFEKIDETHARGPGVIDMKGGNVILVQALKALASTGTLKSMNVTVVMTGDEEDAGEPLADARKALVDAARGAAYAIGFEDGPGDPRTAVIARRGTSAWTVRVKAQPAHSSQIFRKDIGTGAIFEAARILNAFREKMAGEPHLTFNPGAIVGGTSAEFDNVQARGTAFGKTNVIAEHAIVTGDLRTLSQEQLANAKKRWSQSSPARCRTRRRRSRSRTVIRRWRRPKVTTSCWRCTTRRVATSALARSPRSIPTAPAPPTCRSSLAK